jgi:hypothetical protein
VSSDKVHTVDKVVDKGQGAILSAIFGTKVANEGEVNVASNRTKGKAKRVKQN